MIKVALIGGIMRPLKFPTATEWYLTEEGTVVIGAVGKPTVAEIPLQNVLFIERVEEEDADKPKSMGIPDPWAYGKTPAEGDDVGGWKPPVQREGVSANA